MFNYLPFDPGCNFEKEPINKITNKGQLSIYNHTGFWHCMDTYRDYLELNEMWNNNPEWKVW